MKIRFWFLAACVGLGLEVMTHSPSPKPRAHAPTTHYHGYALNKAAIHKAKLFTVLISAEGWGGTERGTGVLLDSTHILTCAHVANNDGDETNVYFYPGYVLAKAHTVYEDHSKDLAIMEIDVPVHGTYAKFQENNYDGEPITIIGNILGSMKWFVSFGIISGSNERDLYTDGLIHGGNSGGPWINERGEVVALTDWGLESNGRELGISGGISAKTINKFLKAWKTPSILDQLFGVMKTTAPARGNE